MRALSPGHDYELAHLDGTGTQQLRFVKRFRGAENHEGTWNQEVLRVLIDRTQVLGDELPSVLTDQILQHLRMALVLHEARALIRKVEKGLLKPEAVRTSPRDGHFAMPNEPAPDARPADRDEAA